MDVIVRFMCSAKAQPFDVHFRPRDGKPARIVAIETVRPKKPTVWERLNPFSQGEVSTETTQLELAKTDFSRFCCPWCGTGKKGNLSSGRKHAYWPCKACGALHCLGAWEVREGERVQCVSCGYATLGGRGGGGNEPLSGTKATTRIAVKSDRMIEKK